MTASVPSGGAGHASATESAPSSTTHGPRVQRVPDRRDVGAGRQGQPRQAERRPAGHGPLAGRADHGRQVGRAARDLDHDPVGRPLQSAHRAPDVLVVTSRLGIVEPELAHALDDLLRLVRRRGAAEAHQHAARAALPDDVEAVGLERVPRQLGGRLVQALRVVARARGGGELVRHRVQPHRDRADQPERPVGAGEQLGQVVAGDVLDHLAARLGDRAVGEHHGHADHEVAHPAVAVAQRAGVGGGDHAADRGAVVGAQRRVQREHLALGGECRPGVGEPHPRLEHGREVADVVLDDLVQAARLEVHGVAGLPAPGKLGAAADGAHGLPRRPMGADPPGQLLDHQNLSARPAISSGCCR